jgi:hypothetical protein
VQKCREVYFATEDYSDATFIIVNGGLFHVFLDYSYSIQSDETRSEYLSYLQVCKNNMETGLANLNLLVPPAEESIEALTLGVWSLYHTESEANYSGRLCHRDIKTVIRLDSRLNCRSTMPDPGLPSRVVNGARHQRRTGEQAPAVLVRLLS